MLKEPLCFHSQADVGLPTSDFDELVGFIAVYGIPLFLSAGTGPLLGWASGFGFVFLAWMVGGLLAYQQTKQIQLDLHIGTTRTRKSLKRKHIKRHRLKARQRKQVRTKNLRLEPSLATFLKQQYCARLRGALSSYAVPWFARANLGLSASRMGPLQRGIRVGEAAHPGPGGRDAARRKSQEKVILSGLREPPKSITSMVKSRIPSRALSEAGVRYLASLARLVPLPLGLRVQVGRLKERERETLGKGKLLGGFLAQLKALVMECDAQGTDGLLAKVRTLVSKQLGANTSPAPPSRTGGAVPPPAATAPAKQVAVVPRVHKGKGKGQGALPAQVAICQKWWPGKVVAATKALSKLGEGCAPDASLVVTTWEQCKSLRVLAAAHKLDAKLAIVCSDLTQPREKPGLPLNVAGSSSSRLVVPLARELPEWGAQPHVSDCSACTPEQENLVTIRVTMAKEFMSEADWALALRKPAGLMMSLLPAGLTVRSYGWHLVQAKEEVVIGFAKLPADSLEGSLVRSGLKGAFIAHPGKTEDRKTVCWLPRREGNNSIDYLRETRQQADVANVGLAYRKGGRDNLGLVGVPSRSDANAQDASQLRIRWAAKGIPNKWSPNQVLQGLTGNKWRCIKDLTAPAKGRARGRSLQLRLPLRTPTVSFCTWGMMPT